VSLLHGRKRADLAVPAGGRVRGSGNDDGERKKRERVLLCKREERKRMWGFLH
jgi:hypothetical protein